MENYFLAHFEIVMRLFYRLPELLICKQCWDYFQLQFAFFRQFLLSGLRHSLPPIFYNFSSCQYKRTQIIIHIISFQNNTNCYACSTPSAPAADLMNCIKTCIYWNKLICDDTEKSVQPQQQSSTTRQWFKCRVSKQLCSKDLFKFIDRTFK